MATDATLRSDDARDHVWSTTGLAPAVKMRRWTDLVSENMTEMTVNTDDPSSYSAHWRQFGLGEVDLNFIASGAQHCLRTPQMIRGQTGTTYELIYVRTGRIVVSGFGVQELVPAGGFTLLRNDEPYEFHCLEPTDALNAHFNDDWLRRWLVHHENFTRVPQDARRAWGAPLAALLETISRQGLQDAAVPRDTIADQIGSLFALMSRPTQSPGRSGPAILRRMRQLMRDSLGECGLSPQVLADRCGISRRYVHAIFAEAGTTFGGELIELRLARARQLLADRRYGSWTIAQVAADCGFSDQSHFSRRFHQRYGLAPMTFKAAAPRL